MTKRLDASDADPCTGMETGLRVRSARHIHEEHNKKDPNEAASRPHHEQEGQLPSAHEHQGHSEHHQHHAHHAHMVADLRRRFWVSLVLTLPILVLSPILVRSNPLDAVAIIKLARATYRKMVQNLIWATGYNTFAIPLAAGALYSYSLLLTPALGAVLMSLSTVIVAINAKLLHVAH